MIINDCDLEKQPSTEQKLDCTPRLYTSDRWGYSFRLRLKSTEDYQPIRRELLTHNSLFDRELDDDQSHWVCLIKIP